jgi:E3 ubiquitin-protein ligase RAD18
MNEATLRKKMAAQGIANWGPKQSLIRRHTEWLNLWNANCDAIKPRTKRDLLQELELWEKSQGGNASQAQSLSKGATLMAKDFDGTAWATDHESDFQQLIARARQKPDTRTTKDCRDEQELKQSE